MIVFVDGTSLIPSHGSHTQNIPPITSVKESKANSAAIEREIDRILDKINREGFENLTDEEHDRLYKGSQSLSRTKKKD